MTTTRIHPKPRHFLWSREDIVKSLGHKKLSKITKSSQQQSTLENYFSCCIQKPQVSPDDTNAQQFHEQSKHINLIPKHKNLCKGTQGLCICRDQCKFVQTFAEPSCQMCPTLPGVTFLNK